MTESRNLADSLQRRGHWLRRFLGSRPIALAMLLAPCITAHAQPDPPVLLHLAHLQGIYVNAAGKPIANADVTLERNDKAVSVTKTDAAGRFAIKHVSGRYWLHLNAKNYSVVHREAVIGAEALTYLHSSTLYIIAGPVACADDCSSVFTSRSEFNRAIRRNSGHND